MLEGVALETFRSGIFLPKGCGNAQNTADAGVFLGECFSPMQTRRMLGQVVAVLPQGTGAKFRLFRYPSPIGRPCDPKHRPPTFHDKLCSSGSQRKIAQIAQLSAGVFDQRAKVGFYAPNYKINCAMRGSLRCRSNDSRFHSWRPLLGLPLAVTLSPSRGSSVRVRAQEPRLSLAAALPPAWSSVQQVTSRTARPQKNANLSDSLYGGSQFISKQATGALHADGLSYVASMLRIARLRTGGRDTYVR